jgi:hypothetical protein
MNSKLFSLQVYSLKEIGITGARLCLVSFYFPASGLCKIAKVNPNN